MERFEVPEHDPIDVPPEESSAIDRPNYLEYNREAREAWFRIFVHLNDAIEQHQAKGGTNEDIVRTMLENFLPPKYDIVEGFLIDHRGVQSKQTDVIIYDRFVHPNPLFNEPGKNETHSRFVPIDLAVATVEVKTVLKDKIRDAFDNIRHTRMNLDPINLNVIPSGIGDMMITGYPTSFVFALSSGWARTSSIKDAIRKEVMRERIQPKSRFDILYVHDRDVTVGWTPGKGWSSFLVRPCDHWLTPLHLTEIVPDDQTGNGLLGLAHFLSQVVLFVTRFSFPTLDRFVYYWGPPVKMKHNADDESMPSFMNES